MTQIWNLEPIKYPIIFLIYMFLIYYLITYSLIMKTKNLMVWHKCMHVHNVYVYNQWVSGTLPQIATTLFAIGVQGFASFHLLDLFFFGQTYVVRSSLCYLKLIITFLKILQTFLSPYKKYQNDDKGLPHVIYSFPPY